MKEKSQFDKMKEFQKSRFDEMNEFQKKQYLLDVQIDKLIEKIPAEYQEDLHGIIKLFQEKENNLRDNLSNI